MEENAPPTYPTVDPAAVARAMDRFVPGVGAEVANLLSTINPVSNGTCEIVRASHSEDAGLTFRGEHEAFSRAIVERMRCSGVSATTISDYEAAAGGLDYRRGVAKFEWSRSDGALDRRIVYYFRQRVAVDEFQESCRSLGIAEDVVASLGWIAAMLGCGLVHVPALALGPSEPMHRLYLAQHDALASADIEQRLASLSAFVGTSTGSVADVIWTMGLSTAAGQPRLVCVAVAFVRDECSRVSSSTTAGWIPNGPHRW